MSESKITPGPWSWEFSRIGDKRIALSNDNGQDAMIATSDIDGHTFIDISKENARLIAAAPELLEACEAFLKFEEHATDCADCEEWGAGNCANGNRLYGRAQDLIDASFARATGETP